MGYGADLVFLGRPRFSLPAGMSHLGCLQRGQWAGLPAMRFTQVCPQRKQSQIMLLGIGIRCSHHNIIFFLTQLCNHDNIV